VSCWLHTTAALPQRKNHFYPLYEMLGGPQCLSGHAGEEKIPSLETGSSS